MLLQEQSSLVDQYERAHLASNTHRSYGSLWKGYVEWCVKNEYNHLPSTVQVVSEYIAYRGSSVSFSTLNAIIASIEYAHNNAGLKILGDKDFITRLIAGIRRTHPENQSVRQAKALTLDKLREVCDLLDVPNPSLMQARDRAVLTVTFFAALRRSELVGLDIKHVEYANKGIILHLMQTKTSDTVQNVYLTETKNSSICPVDAIMTWIQVACITEGPIFCSIKKGGVLAGRIAGESIASIYKKYFGEEYSGHSGRRGLATEAAEAGASILKIQQHTRHKSANMVMRYVESVEGFKNTSAITLGV